MSRKTTTTTIDAEQVFECCVPFSFDLDGHPRTVRRGEHVRGDGPAFVAAPMYYCPVGAPHAERPTVTDFALAGTHSTHEGLPDGDRSRTRGLRLTPRCLLGSLQA